MNSRENIDSMNGANMPAISGTRTDSSHIPECFSNIGKMEYEIQKLKYTKRYISLLC